MGNHGKRNGAPAIRTAGRGGPPSRPSAARPASAEDHGSAGADSQSRPRVLRPLAHYWKFLVAGVVEQGQTGALIPSQRFLVQRMIAPVPKDYHGLIVELGAGTGSLTHRLATRCPKARIVACEINPDLARILETDLAAKALSPRVRVIANAAEEYLDQLAGAAEKPGFVLSGIPLGNLPGPVVVRLLGAIRAALPPGGMYIQFQHSLLDRKRIMAAFASLRTVPVLLNVPPAFVYYARK